MAKVHICIPTDQGLIHSEVVSRVLEMNVEHLGHDLSIDMQSDKPIDNNRNQMVQSFLAHDVGFDYLLFIDSDNAPMRGKNPLELVELDLDIVALPTPMWVPQAFVLGQFPIYWNCFDYVEDKETWEQHFPRKGLQEIDAAGTGSMLIARRVLEKVKPAFVREWDDDGVVKRGSDLLFCKRAKEAGFQVWGHYDYPCHHYKQRDLAEVAKMLRDRDVAAANRPNINTPEYWDAEWKKRTAQPPRSYPFTDALVGKLNGGAVLEYGCGPGDMLANLGPDAVGMDFSPWVIDWVRSKGLNGEVGEKVTGRWDTIVCIETLEHLDDDVGKLQEFFDHTDHVIYSVPNNCLPPAVEPEHRRVYTEDYIRRITPHLKSIEQFGQYLLVEAKREGVKAE